MGQWYFKPQEPGNTLREPIYGEFFAADAISDPGMALVREGIQNSLDAGQTGKKVTVRIYVSGEQNSAPRDQVDECAAGLWPHLAAPENGLRPADLPPADESCPFLAFEDFGTTGLEGDPAEPFRSKTGRKNHFYHFFRAEGQSDKDATDRGSWGVGKQVFFRSSRISTAYGVTVRASDRQSLLMGKAVLKSHWLDDSYCQDGYFGERSGNRSQLVMPVSDTHAIGRFCTTFALSRGDEPGLSVVVPWPDPDITDQAIINAVLRDYFYPIICEQLEVCVETPTVETILDANSLISEVRKLDPSIAQELTPLCELGIWARTLRNDERLEIDVPRSDRAMQWSGTLFPEMVLESLRQKFHDGDSCAIRIPVTIRKIDGTSPPSFVDVYLRRDSSEQSGRPVFIREGIIISRVNSPLTRGVRALVVAEDPPVAEFLRASENPSHTEWQDLRIKPEYRHGCIKDLAFIKRSVHEVVRFITEAAQQEDPTLLIDFFSLPAMHDEEAAVRSKSKQRSEAKGTDADEDIEPPPPPRPRGFRVQPSKGGFSIAPGDEGVEPPRQLEVRVAYSVRRGSALKKYHPADFRLDKVPIRLFPAPKGVKVVERMDNKLLLTIEDADFRIHVTGFDENRDLYVRATEKGVVDGDQTS